MRQVFIRLCGEVTSPQKAGDGEGRSRWRLVVQRYGRLQAIVRGNARLQRETGITLLDVNQFTLGTW